MKITRTLVNAMREEINAALKPIGDKYGLVMEVGSASFTETYADYKLKVSDPVDNWAKCVAHTGLRPDDYGKIGLFGRQKLKIVGFDSSARVNKVQLIDPETGAHFHTNIADTISALKAMDPARAGLENATPAEAEAAKEREFDTKAFICGLKGRVAYGQTFVWGSDTYRVVDLNTKAPKYPIIAENVETQARYRFGKDVLSAVTNGEV